MLAPTMCLGRQSEGDNNNIILVKLDDTKACEWTLDKEGGIAILSDTSMVMSAQGENDVVVERRDASREEQVWELIEVKHLFSTYSF
jgi:hypothetical protein